ncbi:MAG: riboflavin synthase [bacterium]|nr:riboflavin synthase [bacterium]
MFTGIIEEVGEVKKIEKDRLIIKFSKISGLKLGDSVSVNGVCLTVQELGKDFFMSSVMPVTLQKTSLGCLKVKGKVNLERAVSPSGFMGGHFVLGHVDGTGKIIKKSRDSNALLLSVAFPKELSCYFVPQGPVAVDGVSLTIAKLTNEYFDISLIPHTIEMTNLGMREKGDVLNLEADILAKYVQKILSKKEDKSIKTDFVKSCGY